MRSSYVNPRNSLLYNAGYLGDYWSGRADSPGGARELNIISSLVTPSSSVNRYLGSSVRCVAGWE